MPIERFLHHWRTCKGIRLGKLDSKGIRIQFQIFILNLYRNRLAGATVCAVVHLQQEGYFIFIVYDAHCYGVIQGRKQAFFPDYIRYKMQRGGRGFLPAGIVHTVRNTVRYLIAADYTAVTRRNDTLPQAVHIVGNMPAILQGDGIFIPLFHRPVRGHWCAGDADGKPLIDALYGLILCVVGHCYLGCAPGPRFG